MTGEMSAGCRILCAGFIALLPSMQAGCGSPQEVPPKTLEERVFNNASSSDKDVVKGALDKAGISGEVRSITKVNDELWSVDYQPVTADGKRKGGGMMDFPNVSVNPKTGLVIPTNGTGKSRGAGTD